MIGLLKEMLDMPHEVCGHFKIKNGKTTINGFVAKGPNKTATSRGVCHYPPNPHAIHFFHTHPKISHPVPSVEDLLFIVNKPNRLSSTIITRLGVYTIRNTVHPTQRTHLYKLYQKKVMLSRTIHARLESKLRPLVHTAVIQAKRNNIPSMYEFCRRVNRVALNLFTISFTPY